MKKIIIAALAAAGLGLGGCVAVPVSGPYYGDAGYYPAPAVAVGVYSPPVYYGGYGYRRHYRRW
jgi:hypothetical protein